MPPKKKQSKGPKACPPPETGFFEAVLQNTASGLHVYRLEDPSDDNSLRMVFVNEAGAALVGMTREKMAGRLILDLFPGLDKEGLTARYAGVVRDGKGFRVSELYYTVPGRRGAWYSFNVFPLPGGRMGVLFDDITQFKSATAELSLFRTLTETSSDAIFVVEPETGKFVDVNHTACERLGYPRETLLRMSVSDIQEIAQTPEKWRSIAAAVDLEGTVLIEGRHKRADGTAFPVEVSVKGSVVDGKKYFLASARDITDRRKMEEAVKEVDALRGLIPICANCKKIRDDKGFWQRVEVYLEEHSGARFTHGLCQECMTKLYGGEKWFGGTGKGGK